MKRMEERYQLVFNAMLDVEKKRVGVKSGQDGVFASTVDGKTVIESCDLVAPLSTLAKETPVGKIEVGDLLVSNGRIIGFIKAVDREAKAITYVNNEGVEVRKTAIKPVEEEEEVFVILKGSISDMNATILISEVLNAGVSTESVIKFKAALDKGVSKADAAVFLFRESGVNPLLLKGSGLSDDVKVKTALRSVRDDALGAIIPYLL